MFGQDRKEGARHGLSANMQIRKIILFRTGAWNFKEAASKDRHLLHLKNGSLPAGRQAPLFFFQKPPALGVKDAKGEFFLLAFLQNAHHISPIPVKAPHARGNQECWLIFAESLLQVDYVFWVV